MAAVGAVPFTIALGVRCADDPPRLVSVLVYGLCTIALYLGSGVYHLRDWSAGADRILRRFDHANIFLMIAGSATPIAVNVLGGWERLVVMALNWGLAGTGVVLTILTIRLSRWVRTGLYLAAGFVNLLAAPFLVVALPIAANLLFVFGGTLYTVGAVVYASGRPNPLPRILGHHEIFHLFVIAAGAAFAVAIWVWIVPFPRA